MDSSEPAPLYFQPGTPPPPLPMLTAHTNLGRISLDTPTILAHKDIVDKLIGSMAVRRGQTRPDVKPYSKLVIVLACDDDPSLDGRSASPDNSSSSDLSDDSQEKITKPDGELGRPGRGGYNLEQTSKHLAGIPGFSRS
jgi:hypothetical protein